MAYIIADPCVSTCDTACVEVCPVDCIHGPEDKEGAGAEAKEAGVEMHVCSAALQLHEMTEDDLIEECDGVVGAAYMVDVGLESGMVLNY